MGVQQLGGAGQGVAVGGVVRRQVRNQRLLVKLRAPHQQGGDGGDAGAAAHVARQVEQARGIAGPLLGDKRECHGADGHEQKCQAGALHDAAPQGRAVVDIQIEPGHEEQPQHGGQDPEHHQPARLEPAQQKTHNGQEDNHYDAARRKHQAAEQGGISEQRLQKQGQQGGAPVEDESQHQHGHRGEHEIALFEDVEVDHRVLLPQLPNHHRNQADYHDDGKRDDEGG